MTEHRYMDSLPLFQKMNVRQAYTAASKHSWVVLGLVSIPCSLVKFLLLYEFHNIPYEKAYYTSSSLGLVVECRLVYIYITLIYNYESSSTSTSTNSIYEYTLTLYFSTTDERRGVYQHGGRGYLRYSLPP